MRANSIPLLNAAGVASATMATDQVFGPLNLAQIFGYSIQANFTTGVPAGTLKLQASNDGVNWSDITGTSQVVSAVGSFIWNVMSPNYLHVRLVWTASGGSTGSLSALAYIRGF